MSQNDHVSDAELQRLRERAQFELDGLDESFAEVDRKAELATFWFRIGVLILIGGGSFGLGWWARGGSL